MQKLYESVYITYCVYVMSPSKQIDSEKNRLKDKHRLERELKALSCQNLSSKFYDYIYRYIFIIFTFIILLII